MRRRLGMAIGGIVIGLGRWVRPVIPTKLVRAVDDRFFGAVFQVTRVTNDNYGNGTKESPAQSSENGYPHS